MNTNTTIESIRAELVSIEADIQADEDTLVKLNEQLKEATLQLRDIEAGNAQDVLNGGTLTLVDPTSTKTMIDATTRAIQIIGEHQSELKNILASTKREILQLDSSAFD